MYLLGYDVGSSSIKVSLVDSHTGVPVALARYPGEEMHIDAPQKDWAEQDPEMWWDCTAMATRKLLSVSPVDPKDIKAIGISYQMHGLVLVDSAFAVTRPSIIWCDSRAVDIGNRAYSAMGREKCLGHLLNSPGNFTASKIKWVAENEPEVLERSRYFMLPGDFIALRMTGQPGTTTGGLSEGMLWDFNEDGIADFVVDYLGIRQELVPPVSPNISLAGELSGKAAEKLGLAKGTPVTYRAGDQPNNALALGAISSGDVAGTAGTSGVVYAVTDRKIADPQGRVNTFAHVNHSAHSPSLGVLLCINGAGIQYAWARRNMSGNQDYTTMEQLAAKVPVGSDGISILPFGNGAERVLGNRTPGSYITGIDFNRHGTSHLVRASLEGIAFAFVYGIEVLRELGLSIASIRVGNDNLFQSKVFAGTLATLARIPVSVMESTGATGAALAAGFGAGMFGSLAEAVQGLRCIDQIDPESQVFEEHYRAYERWKQLLYRNA